ncbi:aminotransferase class IV [SAR86 cluster bacterium]|nr:aminotransferase class IV [SAR86 cluster bacterium]
MSICYLNGKFLDLKEAKISPLDRGFLFGDAIYEVIASYNNKPFKIEDHLDRLFINLKDIKISVNYSRQEVKNILESVIEKNDLSNQIIYLQISRGHEDIRDHIPGLCPSPTIFVCSFPLKNIPNAQTTSIKASLKKDFRWRKSNIKSTSLLANVMYKIQASEEDFFEIILQENGYITEGAVSNVFCVKNNEVKTPSLENNILPGITRSVIIDIVNKIGIKMTESKISVEDFMNSDEIWITNTTKGILLVSQIDEVQISNSDNVYSKVLKKFIEETLV